MKPPGDAAGKLSTYADWIGAGLSGVVDVDRSGVIGRVGRMSRIVI